MEGKVKIGVLVGALLLLVVTAGSAIAAGNYATTFSGTNVSASVVTNTTLAGQIAQKCPALLGTCIASPVNVSLNDNMAVGGIPIVFNITFGNTTPAWWQVTNTTGGNILLYNASGAYDTTTNFTWDPAGYYNLSLAAGFNYAYIIVNATKAGTYWVNISNPGNSSEFVNITLHYFNITSLKIGGNDLTAGAGTIQAGDYVVYVNVTGPWAPTNVQIDATPFGGVLTTINSITNGTGAITWYNVSGTVQFHTVNNTALTGYLTGSFTLPFVTANNLNVVPNDPYAFYVNTSLNGNTTTGNFIMFGINVTDQYGNINTTFAGNVNYTVVVLSGDATVNPYTGSFASPGTYPIFLNATSKPTKVTIRVTGDWAGNVLVAAEKTFEFFNPVSDLVVSISPTEIYANNSANATLTVQLVDADGNPVKVPGMTVTVSQLVDANHPNLGLTFYNSTGASGATLTDKTDANGRAVFTVRAGVKSGTATIQVSGQGGLYNTTNLTLKQAPNQANINAVINVPAVITAGEGSKIEFTVLDYNNTPIASSSEFPVEFNITAGDAVWSENSAKVYTVSSTDANGNVSATLYSENATTNIQLVIKVKNETGGWLTFGPYAVAVNPNDVADISVSPGLTIGLPSTLGASQVITVRLIDAYGNANASNAQMVVTTDNPVLGNMTNASGTYNNNLVVAIAGGVGTFTYTVNSSTPGQANLTLNVTTFNIVKTIQIRTTAPEDVSISFNNTLPLVNSDLNVTAQLTTSQGSALAYPGVVLTLVVRNPSNSIVFTGTGTTTANGNYTWTLLGTNFTQPGVYTFKVSNATYNLAATSTLTFVGNAKSVEVTVNNTSPVVNDTVMINATFYDANGRVTSALDGNAVTFLINDVNVGSSNINNGVASITYTFTQAGTYNITAFYNVTLQDTYVLTVTQPTPPAPNVSVTGFTVTPTSGPAPLNVTINATVTNTGTAAGNIVVYFYIDGSEIYNETVQVAAGATEYVTYDYTFAAAGTYNVTVNNLSPVQVNVTAAVGETVPDNVNDTLEQLVTKYYPSFDWTTDTPTRTDVLQAVTNAVDQYFSTSDPAVRQEIVDDVTQLVQLYFQLP